MENASKAIIMAGSVLLTIAMVSLLIFGWNKFSAYYSSDDDLADIDDLTKFNLQFTNYERDDVHGYELVSLANKVYDYNTRRSDATGNKSNEWYKPITMTIDFNRMENKFRYSSDLPSNQILFTKDTYSNNKEINNFIPKIQNATDIEEEFGGKDKAEKLAKNIGSLILTHDYNSSIMSETESKRQALAEYISIVGENIELGITSDAIKPKVNPEENVDKNYENDKKNINSLYNSMVNNLTRNGNIMKYYEYYQFKKGIFECTSTDITYDQPTGRVIGIRFTFTGKIE